MKKKIFKNKKEEMKFYDNLDYPKYLKGLKSIKRDDSDITATNKSIALRLPVILLAKIKSNAGSIGVSYRDLIKVYIQEGINSTT